MSGLFARGQLAGRDGVRYTRSKHIGDIGDAGATFGLSGVSTDRSFHLLVPASSGGAVGPRYGSSASISV
jgi:hypothetical protein